MIAYLHGGTANTLFQYAMGYAQAKRFNEELLLDVTSFQRDHMRQYTLSLFPNIKNTLVTGTVPTIHEGQMPYDQALVDRIKPGDCLKGYFQSERYFKQYKYELQDLFMPGDLTPQTDKMAQKIVNKGQRSVFLTVRRTDYVGNTYHGEMTMDYYNAALKIISERVDPYVFVFTDDIPWVRDNFRIPYDMEIAGNYDRTTRDHLGREDEDLFLMSLCPHCVLANSSYSWWGCYLGEEETFNYNKIVIAPEKWFGPDCHEDPRDVYCSNWIVI
jgi:hypothetical protein